MGSLEPIDWLILSLVPLLLLAGYAEMRAQVITRMLRRRRERRPSPRFFAGMNATTCLALAGAMLLALALLVDVYGPDWTPGALGENLSLGLAGSGGVLTLLSLFLDRRSRKRG